MGQVVEVRGLIDFAFASAPVRHSSLGCLASPVAVVKTEEHDASSFARSRKGMHLLVSVGGHVEPDRPCYYHMHRVEPVVRVAERQLNRGMEVVSDKGSVVRQATSVGTNTKCISNCPAGESQPA